MPRGCCRSWATRCSLTRTCAYAPSSSCVRYVCKAGPRRQGAGAKPLSLSLYRARLRPVRSLGWCRCCCRSSARPVWTPWPHSSVRPTCRCLSQRRESTDRGACVSLYMCMYVCVCVCLSAYACVSLSRSVCCVHGVGYSFDLLQESCAAVLDGPACGRWADTCDTPARRQGRRARQPHSRLGRRRAPRAVRPSAQSPHGQRRAKAWP
jgi:hypothetical protein